MKFEKWIKTRQLVTKYGISLDKNLDNSYKDLRMESHWVTWEAAYKCAKENKDD
jgi:hypothetical protein